MSPPRLPQAETRRAVTAYLAALRKGHLPLGERTGAGRRSAQAVAGEKLGLTRAEMATRLAAAKEAGLLDPPAPAAPAPKAKVAASAPKAAPPPDVHERIELRTLREERDAIARQLREAEVALQASQRTQRAAIGLRDCPPEALAWPPVGPVTPDAPGVPCFAWSDWHLGETVDPAQVYRVNAFNEEVAVARVERLVERSIYLATKHVARPEYSYAVLILGGDFVSGWLHEELIATDWCTPLQAVRLAVRLLRAAILRMCEAFGRLVVVGVPGNHGRLFKRPPGKLGAYQAHDWLIYGMLSDGFGSDGKVMFIIPAEGDYVLHVHSTRYNVMHGHELGVKGGDGIIGAIGPIMRGRQKAGRAASSMGRDFDVLVLGHFHQHLWLPNSGLIVNNCLIGYNEYAKAQKYVATTPSQTMWWTHPKYGAVCGMEVFVEDPRMAVTDAAA